MPGKLQSIATLFVVAGSLGASAVAAPAPQHLELQAGKHRIAVDSRTERGLDFLEIQFDHFGEWEFDKNYPWYGSRFAGIGDRFGARNYWTQDVPDWEPLSLVFDGSASVNCNDATPALFETHKFSASISSDFSDVEAAARRWMTLDCLAAQWEPYLALFPILEEFARKHRRAIKTFGEAMWKKSFSTYVLDPAAKPYRQAWSAALMLGEILDTPSARRASYLEARQRLLGGEKTGFEKARYISDRIAQPLLFVTHATWLFDPDMSIRAYLDKVIAGAKKAGYKTAYLMNNDGLGDASWYPRDRAPDLVQYSRNGEHSIQFDSSQAILTGGYFEECWRSTLHDTISRWFLNHSEPLTIHIPLGAVYSHRGSLDFKKIGTKALLQEIHQGTVFGRYEVETTDHDVTRVVPSDMNALLGVPKLADYEFEIFFDHQRAEPPLFHGPKKVRLQFWSADEFLHVLPDLLST